MKHYNNYYVKFDDDELRQILKEISDEEVRVRIRSALGETVDPIDNCLLYTSPSPRDRQKSRMPSSA